MAENLNRPLVVIVGPTATGKSKLAIRLAKQFDGEIVSADSWVVRKGVDIGTAKPSPEDMQSVPHHMIDIINPQDDYSAAIFKDEALNVIDSIHKRGKLPFMVGGTGLYIDSILFNYSFLPAASEETRRKLNAMSLDDLLVLAKEQNLPLDQVDQRNKRRVIRLIETNGAMPKKGQLRSNTLIVGISTTKDELRRLVSVRVEEMIEAGLEGEVKVLAETYGWDCEALKGIGYHEWRLYFEGSQSLELTKERIIKDTLNLAKRQQTWFKRNKSIHWITTPVKYTDIEEIFTTYLSKNHF